VTFRRDLSRQILVAWNALLQHLANIQLQDGHDEFCWNLHKNGKNLVASMYNALILPDVPIDKVSNDKLWKLKIPLRIKVFGLAT
jgi:AMMECR1 domain-containing protein